MGKAGDPTNVIDAGPLIAFDRGDARARSFIREARASGVRLVVPAAVLAQVWRDGTRQARLARFIASPHTDIEILDELASKAVGSLLARSRTSDVVDGSVVLTARRYGAVVLTGDAADLLRIDPGLEVAAL